LVPFFCLAKNLLKNIWGIPMTKQTFYFIAVIFVIGLSVFIAKKTTDQTTQISLTEMSNDANNKIQEPSDLAMQIDASQTIQQPTAPQKKSSDMLNRRYQAVSDNPNYPTIDDRIAELQNMYPEKTFDAEQVVDTLSKRSAWKETDKKTDGTPFSEKELNDGRDVIEYDRERIAVSLPGDKLELPIQQIGGSVITTIESVTQEGNNTTTWIGRVEGKGATEVMRVVITQGDGISVGSIETDKGNFTLQSNDNKGWIASNDKLFKHDPRDGMLSEQDHPPHIHEHDHTHEH
jgi:hypothetical protein